MLEYNFIDTIKITGKALINSEAFVLVILELAILLVMFLFRNVVQSRVLKITGVIAASLVLLFYGFNYVDTISVFINNVTTNIVELIYYPTSLEFISVLLLSLAIMLFTLGASKNTLLKAVNVCVPVIISFLLFGIVEYINTNNITFDEYSVFTNPVLSSMHELGMGLFIAWIAGLIIYKIDVKIINNIKLKSIKNYKPKEYTTINIPSIDEINSKSVEVDTRNITAEFELPRLKK